MTSKSSSNRPFPQYELSKGMLRLIIPVIRHVCFDDQPSAQPTLTFDPLLHQDCMHALSRSFRTSYSRLFSTMHRAPAAMVQRMASHDVEIHQTRDPSTLSNYNAWQTKHITVNLEIDFTKKRLWGNVVLKLKRFVGAGIEGGKVVLDSR